MVHKIKNFRYQLLIVLFSAVILLFSSSSATFALQAYGNDAYGNCEYNSGCTNNIPPSTVVPIGPSPSNPTHGRAFSVNLVNDQVITSRSYVVLATPNFSKEQIEKVSLYQGDELIGESSIAEGESYQINWEGLQDGSYIIRVVVVLKDGTFIERQFTVTVLRQLAVSGIDEDSSQGQVDDREGDKTNSPNQSFISATIGAISNALKKIIDATPKEIAYALPYLVLAGLVGLAVSLLFQTRNQLRYIGFLVALLKKDKQLADEKTTFIMLVSHHVRTPITIIKSFIELAMMDKPEDQELLEAQGAANKLHNTSEAILADIEGDHYLKDIVAPDVSKMQQRLYRSWQLIVPAFLSVVLLVSVNVIYLVAGKTQVIIPNIIFQIILSVTITVVIHGLVQRRRQRIIERGKLMQQRDHQLALDKARNIFIKRAVQEMTPLLDTLKVKSQQVNEPKGSTAMSSSIEKLQLMLERFELASELEQGKVRESISNFDLRAVMEHAVEQSEDYVAKKNLTIKQIQQSLQLHQNKFLVDYVVNVLLDNAVRYAKYTTTVAATIKNVTNTSTQLDIQNQGVGISPEKLAYLFQPFSSSSNVEVSSEQGVGLNLYLSRLMMRYLGGDVSLQSVPNKITTATIKLPLDMSA